MGLTLQQSQGEGTGHSQALGWRVKQAQDGWRVTTECRPPDGPPQSHREMTANT